jgi:hypothetical protein
VLREDVIARREGEMAVGSQGIARTPVALSPDGRQYSTALGTMSSSEGPGQVVARGGDHSGPSSTP